MLAIQALILLSATLKLNKNPQKPYIFRVLGISLIMGYLRVLPTSPELHTS